MLLGDILGGGMLFLLKLDGSIGTDELCVMGLALLTDNGFARIIKGTIDLKDAGNDGIDLLVVGMRVFSNRGIDVVGFHHDDGAFLVVRKIRGLFDIDHTHSVAALEVVHRSVGELVSI